jgi:release factor glutamine methyltransferase
VSPSEFEKLLSAQKTVAGCYRMIRDRLMRAGISAADIEARHLVRAAFPLPLGFAAWEDWRDWEDPRHVDGIDSKAKRLTALTERRLAGEPVDRIVGSRGFWTLDFVVTPAVLSPRSDTEAVVRAARDILQAIHPADAPLSILDLGTGSGAILLALLDAFQGASGIGVDISCEALAVAQDNADRLMLSERSRFIHGGWDVAIGQRFDLVVSNPPYIPTADIAGLDPEVRDHDPHLALDGGADGLDCYRAILPLLPRLLTPTGFAVLEIGFGQGDDVSRLAADAGLSVLEIRPDLGGVPRAVVLSVNPPSAAAAS